MSSNFEIRLFDSQWLNIVNYDSCFAGFLKEEAVAKAVKMTEEAMAKNFKENKWPLAGKK